MIIEEDGVWMVSMWAVYIAIMLTISAVMFYKISNIIKRRRK